jgi:hypothetical protein
LETAAAVTVDGATPRSADPGEVEVVEQHLRAVVEAVEGGFAVGDLVEDEVFEAGAAHGAAGGDELLKVGAVDELGDDEQGLALELGVE